MLPRTLFDAEHDAWRDAVRGWIATEVVPHQARWRAEGQVDRAVWRSAGEHGILCPWLAEEHGGPGGTFLHSVVVIEELARALETGFAAPLHSDIVVPYLHAYATDAVKAAWLPRCASGEAITALAMTEPDTGSDVAAIRTTATRVDGGWRLDGAKTFISNGQLCDVVIVAARSGGDDVDPRRRLSLFVVPCDSAGFSRGRRLDKIGMASQDTSEMHFDGVVVPDDHLLARPGDGFGLMMRQLQQERLVVAIAAQATAARALDDTVTYVKERHAFGKPIASFQNTRFELAECATEIALGQAFIDQVVAAHVAGAEVVTECSMAKWWHTDMAQRVVDRCLQLHGGYGYMHEVPISHAFVDARVQRIYAGTNEIMKVIIAQRLGL